MLPKTSTYVKSYDGQTRLMYFLIEDDDLLEKYKAMISSHKILVDKKQFLCFLYNFFTFFTIFKYSIKIFR